MTIVYDNEIWPSDFVAVIHRLLLKRVYNN